MLRTGFLIVLMGLTAMAAPAALHAEDAAPVMAQAPAAFFQNLPDLPMMPGMQELPEEGVVFDQPEGRIVEAASLLPRPDGEASIREFYARTLPALGWTPGTDGSFSREGETLKIEIVPRDGVTMMKVAVAPR